MKKVFILLFCFVAIPSLYAQKLFDRKDHVIAAGAGIGPHGAAIQASYEHCILDRVWDDKSSIGLGGSAGWYSDRYKYGIIPREYDYNRVVVGLRGSLHYQFVSKLDTYAGGLIGYAFDDEKNVDADGLAAIGFIGARYYFFDFLGVYLEFGVGVTNATTGICVKF